ncbi:MAG: hypothetical protein R6V77_08385 [Candidatus Cloacimonadaceae bacterium]
MLKLSRFIFIFILLGSCLTLFAIDWKTWQYNDIQITAAPKDTAYASIIVRSLSRRINAFQMKLGVYPVQPLLITILPNRQEYEFLTTGKGKIVESSLAFYSPREKKIYVRSPDQIAMESYDGVLMHEYIHWFLDETLSSVPLWFHEGMAFYYSGQFGFPAYYSFTRYRFMGYKLSLTEMVYQYPRLKSYWNMFYLTSAFAINHLQSKHHDRWEDFWDNVSLVYNSSGASGPAKSDFTRTFYASFRMSQFAFSNEFDKVLKRYGWQFPLIGINALIFSLLPIIILLAWLKHRRKLKAMPELVDEVTEETATPETPQEETEHPPAP